jgi:homoserine/homoserine lactone efflux protein
MTIDNWFAFLFLAIIATSTPGPAVLLIMTNATIYGWGRCIYIAIGNIAALLIMAVITVSGLGIILTTSEIIFSIIKYLGAGYLIYLGINFLLNNQAFSLEQSANKINNPKSSLSLFMQAFGVAISNPKAIIFLTALFPQFINPNDSLIPQFIILISTLMILSFLFLMAYAILGNRIKNFLKKPRRIKYINRISGLIFIGMGTLLVGVSNK